MKKNSLKKLIITGAFAFIFSGIFSASAFAEEVPDTTMEMNVDAPFVTTENVTWNGGVLQIPVDLGTYTSDQLGVTLKLNDRYILGNLVDEDTIEINVLNDYNNKIDRNNLTYPLTQAGTYPVEVSFTDNATSTKLSSDSFYICVTQDSQPWSSSAQQIEFDGSENVTFSFVNGTNNFKLQSIDHIDLFLTMDASKNPVLTNNFYYDMDAGTVTIDAKTLKRVLLDYNKNYGSMGQCFVEPIATDMNGTLMGKTFTTIPDTEGQFANTAAFQLSFTNLKEDVSCVDVKIGKTQISDSQKPLPEGVDYDNETNTLTLTNYTAQKNEDFYEDIDCEFNKESFLTVKLVGDNTIGNIYCLNSLNHSGIRIIGDGVLNIKNVLQTCETWGINLDHGTLKMESGTVNIQGLSTDPYDNSFIGINSFSDDPIELLGGEISITADGGSYGMQCGIRSTTNNIVIKNSKLSIDLPNSPNESVGLEASYNSDSNDNGKITIENAQIDIHVASKSTDPDVRVEAVSCTEWENLDQSLLYVGDSSADKKVTESEAFQNWTDANGKIRYACKYPYLKVTKEEKKPNKFGDVHENDWFSSSVGYVNQNGFMTGLNETTFGPMQNLARAQFATILYRIEGSLDVSYTARFPDVPDGQFYTKAVLWANQAGVVSGYQNGYFGPGDNINREQMAVMMYRYAKYKRYDVSAENDLSVFPDRKNVSSFATEAMQWAVGAGLITGDGGKVNPQGTANRAVCATIITRFMKYYK